MAYQAAVGSNVYWVGTDGNVWLKSAEGTSNMGKLVSGMPGGFTADGGSENATYINDPNPQPVNNNTGGEDTSYASSGSYSGTSTPTYSAADERAAYDEDYGKNN